ncbi:family 43 glycosylhydrolase [Actinomadura keratinilytica]|uniref:CBM6 domain-containing protein n=1 Tax=Actinomadura keratinilytica TaxID=547461 RepID=A0ABP7Y3D7_9ACTN
MDLRARGPLSSGGPHGRAVAPVSALAALVVLAGLAGLHAPDPGLAGADGRNGPRAGRPAPSAGASAGASRTPAPPVPSPAQTATPFTAPGYSPVKPVIGDYFADPTVVKAAGTYYAYGTNSPDAMMPVATAPSPTGPWTRRPGDGLARLPAWAASGWTWAPEVVPPRPGGRTYLLYFSARRNDRDMQCIGVATSTSPAGPFVPLDGEPLVCPTDLGGAIDPASYIAEDGTRYLLYKTDARSKAAIHLVRLTADGLRLAGPPKRILGRGAGEPVLVEAPDLVRRGGKYVLFYSAGWYFDSSYQTRYAVASSIEGPYEKAAGPLLSTGGYGGRVRGPGSVDVLADTGGDYLVFHGIRQRLGGSKVNRGMYVAALGWDGARPVVRGAPVRYEAERARLNGCMTPLRRPRASGGRAAGPSGGPGCSVDVAVFAPVAGRYSVRIQYANWSRAKARLEVTVNGAAPAPLGLRRTKKGSWTSATVQRDLSAGWNTLGLRRLDGGGQIDYVEVR